MTATSSKIFECMECKMVYSSIELLQAHNKRAHCSSSGNVVTSENLSTSAGSVEVEVVKKAFRERIITLSILNKKEECLLPMSVLQECYEAFRIKIGDYLRKHIALKFNIELHGLYAKPNLDNLEMTPLEFKRFQTKMEELYNLNEFENSYQKCCEKIQQKADEFQERDSGWTLVQLIKVELNLNKYQPLKGSTFMPLPIKLQLKKACINIKNSDQYCFKWAVISAIADLKKNAHEPTRYNVKIVEPRIQVRNFNLDFSGLCFPLKIKDVAVFERKNPNININIFGYDTSKDLVVGPYHKGKNSNAKHINIMFLENYTSDNAHYVWIKNMSR